MWAAKWSTGTIGEETDGGQNNSNLYKINSLLLYACRSSRARNAEPERLRGARQRHPGRVAPTTMGSSFRMDNVFPRGQAAVRQRALSRPRKPGNAFGCPDDLLISTLTMVTKGWLSTGIGIRQNPSSNLDCGTCYQPDAMLFRFTVIAHSYRVPELGQEKTEALRSISSVCSYNF
jgi:hypothetical protein